jgi:hypothetical protein
MQETITAIALLCCGVSILALYRMNQNLRFEKEHLEDRLSDIENTLENHGIFD